MSVLQKQRFDAEIRIDLGDVKYSAPCTSVQIEGPTYSGQPEGNKRYLVLKAVSDTSADEASNLLATLAGTVAKALNDEYHYKASS